MKKKRVPTGEGERKPQGKGPQAPVRDAGSPVTPRSGPNRDALVDLLVAHALGVPAPAQSDSAPPAPETEGAPLKLQQSSLSFAKHFRGKFDANPAAASEDLLETLAISDSATADQLSSLEAAAVCLATRALDNPALIERVVKVALSISTLAEAVRGRMRRTLTTAADLRAQRKFQAKADSVGI
jgi:hypothetical protein